MHGVALPTGRAAVIAAVQRAAVFRRCRGRWALRRSSAGFAAISAPNLSHSPASSLARIFFFFAMSTPCFDQVRALFALSYALPAATLGELAYDVALRHCVAKHQVKQQKTLLFNPLALPAGIEPSADPVLLARPPTYAVRFTPRAQ